MAEQTEPALWGPEQAAGLAHLAVEYGNLRRALGWVRTGGADPQVVDLLRVGHDALVMTGLGPSVLGARSAGNRVGRRPDRPTA